MHILILLLLSLFASARTITPVSGDYAYQTSPEYKAVLAQVKSLGEFTQMVKEQHSRPMSQGERMVEAAKARNRVILAKQYEAEKKKTIQPIDTRMVNEQWKAEVASTHENWKREVESTRRQWQKEQAIFLGRIKEYQATTFEIPAPKEKIVEVEVPKERLPEVHIVRGAFEVSIRDQRRRPTCAAFAGVRAMEILLAQNGQKKLLSPQYFYWASKPKCQSAPCTEKGSWVTPGLRFSKTLTKLDIPREESCPYSNEVVPGNETQLPLSASCQSGEVKVEAFEEPRTLAETVEKLKQNIPVIMAAKLSWNFYKNEGLVTLADAKKPSPLQMDYHSMGHAVLAVGVLELPQKVQSSEGNFCILVANSWGKGWGAGGYACLTEKWLQQYRQSSPFVAVTKLQVQ